MRIFLLEQQCPRIDNRPLHVLQVLCTKNVLDYYDSCDRKSSSRHATAIDIVTPVKFSLLTASTSERNKLNKSRAHCYIYLRDYTFHTHIGACSVHHHQQLLLFKINKYSEGLFSDWKNKNGPNTCGLQINCQFIEMVPHNFFFRRKCVISLLFYRRMFSR